jgi:hypothetical protein
MTRKIMKRKTLVLVLSALAALVPLRPAQSQTTAPFPEIDELRAWLDDHHPSLTRGDSGVNAAVVVIDTSAHYVRSIVFRLGAGELPTWQGAVQRALSFQDDTVSRNLLAACVGSAPTNLPTTRPICVQDGARVHAVDYLRFLAGRDIDILKSDAALKRFGPDAAQGAVVVTTDTAAFERFKSLGATPANFVSFEGRRIRRPADGEPVVITVLMLSGTLKGSMHSGITHGRYR